MKIQTQYEHLRDEFVKISKPHLNLDALEDIKNEYCCNIDSKRTISSIKNLEKLIRVLEKYDILSYNNIKVLHSIEKKYINELHLQSILKNYENWFEQLNIPACYNMYINDDIQPRTSNHDQETCDRTIVPNSLEGCICGFQSNIRPQQLENSRSRVAFETKNCYTNKENSSCDEESELKKIVVLKISELVGRSWKNVCRYMDLKECQIDEIQDKHPYDLKEQSFQALQICISENDSKWKVNILRALEKGRRKDIKEAIEQILLCERM